MGVLAVIFYAKYKLFCIWEELFEVSASPLKMKPTVAKNTKKIFSCNPGKKETFSQSYAYIKSALALR